MSGSLTLLAAYHHGHGQPPVEALECQETPCRQYLLLAITEGNATARIELSARQLRSVIEHLQFSLGRLAP